MVQGCDERLGNVGAGNAFVQRERRLGLPDPDGALNRWAIQQKGSSHDGVVQSAGADGLLCTPSPENRIAFPQVQAPREQRLSRDTDGRHVHETATEVVSPGRLERIDDAFILGCPDDRLTREPPAPDAGGENDVADACKCGNERMPLRHISMNDLGIGANALQGSTRIAREDPDANAFALQCVHRVQARRPCATDDENEG